MVYVDDMRAKPLTAPEVTLLADIAYKYARLIMNNDELRLATAALTTRAERAEARVAELEAALRDAAMSVHIVSHTTAANSFDTCEKRDCRLRRAVLEGKR